MTGRPLASFVPISPDDDVPIQDARSGARLASRCLDSCEPATANGWLAAKATGEPDLTIAITPATERGRVETLDLLRAVAVLAVLFYHYAFRGAAADAFTDISLPALVPLAKYASLGVQLFFVISGFVIAYSAEGRTAAGFAIARVARIYPAFLLCMTVTFVITLAIGAPRFEASAGQWLANLIMVAPALKQPFMDGAYWSIVNEITFYGWVFVLIALGLFRRGIIAIVIVWIAISMVNEALLHSGLLRRLFVTDQSGFFCAGLVLYEIFRGRRDRTVMLLLVLAALTAIDQAFIGAAWDRAHYKTELDNLVIAAITLASIGAVALAMRVRRLPAPPGLIVAIGGLTYPLYLLHQHIGYMLLNAFAGRASPALLIAAVMLTMLLGAWLVWRVVERPAQRWLKAILTRALQYLGARVNVTARPASVPAPRDAVTAPISGGRPALARSAAPA
jgi:peptidoglycan/LPS O-acetylase OafA/YrhL